MRQARAQSEQAAADARTARGAYDPSVSASWEEKTFGGSQYFDYLKGTATVPTPLGVDLKFSYENARGRYLNPDRRTPSPGLLSFGVSLPVGQRWLVDERRTALQVAREGERIAEADVRAAGNRVILDATRDYARWAEVHRRTEIAREGVTMARSRYEFTRTRVASGEAAPMDTVEALLEVQRRTSTLTESEQLLFNARAALALHLWDANGRPVALSRNAVPSFRIPQDTVMADDLAARFAQSHPDILKAASRVAQSRAQQQLTAAQRIPLPTLDISALSESNEFPLNNSVNYGANPDNLKRSASVTVPLLSLKERGRAASAAARYRQSLVDQSRLELLITTNISVALMEMRTAGQLLELQRAIVDNSALLVRGEDTRFRNGESTLLLVMLRERALLDEMLRLAAIELRLLSAFGERVALTGEWETLVGTRNR
ncbi:MAG: TolC family protein [Phycisphaerae bacterium]|nr:TolC family protein [Gemmatimonadaceae bacterium]